ncbi:MAG TPA: NADH:flavin oxidoreductase/NADH oxidase [Bryobacteraceae bacterium]|jgi:2,4-dienoyl-CoA reductase-like NADH-dependent reductase (Old Yellow Enzyme family)
MSAHLFDPLTIRGVTFPNRIAVSPMCEYSSVDGFANDWHLVHLGSRGVGGASVVFTEATSVSPEGRISPVDLGIWKDAHIEMLARIAKFLAGQGCLFGVQLAHAGRKASTAAPWEGMGPVAPADGGWIPIGPSAIPFSEKHVVPVEMTEADIARVTRDFGTAATRALEAGFRVAEIHAAHGYLLQEFLSPISNQRTDRYGGSFENRIRMLLEVTAEVRRVWPERLPLFVRISATDWDERGWTVDESVELARRLGPLGVDLLDCSSAGNIPQPAHIPFGSGYQTAMADRIRRESGMRTGAVGMITSAAQAEHIVFTGQADMVLIAREMLRDPYFPLRAAKELEQKIAWPRQYSRAAPKGSAMREPLE